MSLILRYENRTPDSSGTRCPKCEKIAIPTAEKGDEERE